MRCSTAVSLRAVRNLPANSFSYSTAARVGADRATLTKTICPLSASTRASWEIADGAESEQTDEKAISAMSAAAIAENSLPDEPRGRGDCSGTPPPWSDLPHEPRGGQKTFHFRIASLHKRRPSASVILQNRAESKPATEARWKFAKVRFSSSEWSRLTSAAKRDSQQRHPRENGDGGPFLPLWARVARASAALRASRPRSLGRKPTPASPLSEKARVSGAQALTPG